MPETQARPVRGLRRLSLMPHVLVRCPDWWGESHCWHHSRKYRAMCREDPDVCPWEVTYVRDVTRYCPMVH